ncbi:MAG: hypothetical protein WC577_01395 [Candidatus Paceibacterota bacterium]
MEVFAQSINSGPGSLSSGNASPMIVNIGPKGNVLMRGIVVGTPGTDSIKVKSWGGSWEIKISITTKLMSVGGVIADLQDGDFVGVLGSISSDGAFVINASIVREWRQKGVQAAVDFDHDGILDVEDADDDNDGILDVNELGKSKDHDNDGIPDVTDTDDDGDGIPDVTDDHDDDFDNDGIRDTRDHDDDNDGKEDRSDLRPHDTDDDGKDNDSDDDDDNDGEDDDEDEDDDNDGEDDEDEDEDGDDDDNSGSGN